MSPRRSAPVPIGNLDLVEISAWSRLPASALPRISSDASFGVAVGRIEQVHARFEADVDHAPSPRRPRSSPKPLKNSLAPPNVAAPKLSAETLRPEPPSSRYSIFHGCHETRLDASVRLLQRTPNKQEEQAAPSEALLSVGDSAMSGLSGRRNRLRRTLGCIEPEPGSPPSGLTVPSRRRCLSREVAFD